MFLNPKRATLAGFFLIAVLGCALTHATDLKTYRNTQYGFEFQYPGDMEVAVSSGPKTSVLVAYRAGGKQGRVDVGSTLSIDRCISAEACLSQWYSNASNRQQMLNAPKSNGFIMGDNTTDCDMGGSCLLSQHFVKRTKRGLCYAITRSQWASKLWFRGDIDADEQKRKDDSDTHYEGLMEIVKSFRFLDSKSSAQ